MVRAKWGGSSNGALPFLNGFNGTVFTLVYILVHLWMELADAFEPAILVGRFISRCVSIHRTSNSVASEPH
jgi:hypothetical protein